MSATHFSYHKVFLVVCFVFKIIKADESNAIPSGRTPKYLVPFLGVGQVRFENGVCSGSGGLDGTCYRRRQCSYLDGIGSTRCANGLGVCCVFQRTCGETSQLNNTYFVSPRYPSVYTSSSVCTYTIKKIDPDICQARIDFLTLRLAPPNGNGTCNTDALIVSGGASNVPVLCGDNTGQHIYVDFNGKTSITISISTSGSFASTAWNIKVAQINCNCPYKAPSGCLQFYNAASGTVMSFNYGSAAPQDGTRQLADLNYGVCIATVDGFCGIQWSQSGANTFSVSNNTYTYIADGTVGTIGAEIFGSSCLTDFVVIPDPTLVSTDTTALTADRFCGNGFATVRSYSQPFVLTVVTDGNEVGDTGNAGFSLAFSQMSCALSVLVG